MPRSGRTARGRSAEKGRPKRRHQSSGRGSRREPSPGYGTSKVASPLGTEKKSCQNKSNKDGRALGDCQEESPGRVAQSRGSRGKKKRKGLPASSASISQGERGA